MQMVCLWADLGMQFANYLFGASQLKRVNFQRAGHAMTGNLSQYIN